MPEDLKFSYINEAMLKSDTKRDQMTREAAKSSFNPYFLLWALSIDYELLLEGFSYWKTQQDHIDSEFFTP